MKKLNLPMSNKLVFIGGPPGVGKSTEKIDTVDKSPIEIADILKLKIIS